MCGIMAYLGDRDAKGILLDGLARLEYRGYDSAGLALHTGGGVMVRKVEGSVSRLRAMVGKRAMAGSRGIAHIRWATHGAPTAGNAHPHVDCRESLAVVHNGTIENASTLRVHLEKRGHRFRSDTDSEVLAHLIEEEGEGSLEVRVSRALGRVHGAYGLAVLSADEPDKIVVARRGSPLLLGIGETGELFASSDAAALLTHTRSVVYLGDGEIGVLEPAGHRILGGTVHARARDRVDRELEAIDLGAYTHFMEKEIVRQPETVRDALRGRLDVHRGTARLSGLNLTPDFVEHLERVVLVGRGTSWHAGLVGRHLIESLARIPVQVEDASEFRHRRGPSLGRALVVAVSQSGETWDTLEAMRTARRAGAPVVGVVNVVGSTMARESDGGIYLRAGPEIGIASTKGFTAQLAVLSLLALFLGRHRGLGDERARAFAAALGALPEQVEKALSMAQGVERVAREVSEGDHALLLGPGISFPVALEGALKLTQVGSIHADGSSAAGPGDGHLALIDETTPAIFVAPRGPHFRKVLGAMEHVRARGGRTILITTGSGADLGRPADHVIRGPRMSELLSPITTVVPLQLLAYETAVLRGRNVDRPRILAGGVTAE